jgi:tetratricopeptide (TPR) repeat protein
VIDAENVECHYRVSSITWGILVESAAPAYPFSYSAAVFSIPIFSRAFAGLGIIACTACAGAGPKPDAGEAPQAFYTVTGEIALSRHEPRVAALEYAAAAETDTNLGLLQRAADVTSRSLQPSLTLDVAGRWIDVDPTSVEAHRMAARAALDLHQIEKSATHYRVVLSSSPRGTDAEFAALETELASAGSIFGARQLADRLVVYFPASAAALRLQAYTALRADDPAAAVHSFNAALAAGTESAAGATGANDAAEQHGAVAKHSAGQAPSATGANDAAEQHGAVAKHSAAQAPNPAGGNDAGAIDAADPVDPAPSAQDVRRAMTQGLWRARILAGDADEPLAQARALLDAGVTAAHRLDYALLLLAAQRNAAARTELVTLTHDPQAAPVALRLLGLIDLQEGELDNASVRFAELAATGKLLDDALFYLGVIAERHADLERALKFYAQVQTGENAVPALLHAATILRAHGAAPAAEELLDRLVEEEPQRAPEILAARARIYADAGDMSRAVDVLDAAALQYPDSVELRYALASTFEEQGKVAVAVRELKAVAKLRPDDPAALNAYGFTLADHNRRLRKARQLIEKAHASAPKNAAILDSLGWVLFRQGHADQALPYLNAAYVDDRGGDIAAHLGEVLWQQGKHADAERIWSEAARADAENPLLKTTRLRLHASQS